MSKVFNKLSKRDGNASHITLRDWLIYYYDKDSLAVLFANMDSAMKYIHNKGYCIQSFNPVDIEILNSSLSQIKFNHLMEMSSDFLSQKTIIKEDIGKSAFLQIGIYAKCLDKLNPSFLKENFDKFSSFLPNDVVPYYRGVIERNASVYLGDYLQEKTKREIEALDREVGGLSSDKKLVKSNFAGKLFEYDSMNTAVNDSIYKQLNSNQESAFVRFLALPFLLIVLGLILFTIIFII